MKSAIIPYLSTKGRSLAELQRVLETSGKRLPIATLNWENDYPYCPIAIVDVAYSEEGLLLHYFVRGEDLRTTSEGDGHYVHEDSCVEFFMQREEGEAYINFEFNAAGVCYASHHKNVEVSTLLTTEEFESIKRIATYEGQKIVEEHVIREWELMALIPWTTMGYPSGIVPKTLRANFYKCGDKTAHPHYLSWSPVKEDYPAFHRPQYFGTLHIGD